MYLKLNTYFSGEKSRNINFSDLKLSIDDKQIDRIGHGCREESFKFVGIHLDELLTWDSHAKVVQKKQREEYFILFVSSHTCFKFNENIYLAQRI